MEDQDVKEIKSTIRKGLNVHKKFDYLTLNKKIRITNKKTYNKYIHFSYLASYCYYNTSLEIPPVFEDFEYDKVVKGLKEYEDKNPQSVSPLSPNSRVGSIPSNKDVDKMIIRHNKRLSSE